MRLAEITDQPLPDGRGTEIPDRSICPTYYLIATQLIAGGTSLIQLIVASLTIVLSPRDYKSKWRSYLYINNYTDWSARYCSIWKSWQRSI